MISLEKACACLEAAAADLKKMSYQELEEFAQSHGMLDDWRSQERLVDGEKVDVNTMVSKLGRLRKRISVELTLSAEGQLLPVDTPCLYFERYQSGRLYPSPREEAREAALFKSLPFVFLGGALIALAVLLWHLCLSAE